MKKRINGISSAMLTTAPTVRTNVKQCIMKQFYLKVIAAFIFTVMLPLSVQAYLVPELMYYKFNNAGGNTVANAASSPVGTNPAPVVNLTMGGVGQFGSALIGSGGDPTADYVNTGWATSLSSGGWTIAFWLNNFDNDTSGNPSYLFGDLAASTFRCFLNGAANPGNILLRGGGLTDVLVSGVYAAQPSVVHFVYDPAVPEIRAYLNGVLNNTVAQPSVNISGAGFDVGGYDGGYNSGLPSGALLDEFRVYSRALPAQEIAGTWNKELSCIDDTDNDNYGVGCLAGSDCNDNNSAIHATVTYYPDADGDGYRNADNGSEFCLLAPPAGYLDNSSSIDADDTDPFYTDILPTCEVKVIPKTLGWLIGDREKTRWLLIIGKRGTDFAETPAIKWESDAIDVVSMRVFFKRFMFMRATFFGEPLEKQEYRVLVGECEGTISWAK